MPRSLHMTIDQRIQPMDGFTSLAVASEEVVVGEAELEDSASENEETPSKKAPAEELTLEKKLTSRRTRNQHQIN